MADRPYVEMAMLHDIDGGNRVALNPIWVTTIRETDAGTVFTFADGSSETVEGNFDQVTEAFSASVPTRRARKR